MKVGVGGVTSAIAAIRSPVVWRA